MSSRRFVSACLILLTAGLVMAGCEAEVSTGGFDNDAAATKIQDQYPDKTGGAKLTSIECDGDDDAVGATFTCDATNDSDVAVEIEGKITSNENDSTNFHWEVTKLVAKGPTFGDVAADTLAKTRAVDTVECPDGIVIEKGTIVDCVATMDDGSERKVKLTLTDGSGNFHIDLLGPVSGG